MKSDIVLKIVAHPRFMNVDDSGSDGDLTPMDHYRRDLNSQFTGTVFKLYDQRAYEESNSESSIEAEESIEDGELIYLLVWLGKDRGHKPLEGLTTSDKRDVAKKFLQKNRLPDSYQEELEQLIAQKIRN